MEVTDSLGSSTGCLRDSWMTTAQLAYVGSIYQVRVTLVSPRGFSGSYPLAHVR